MTRIIAAITASTIVKPSSSRLQRAAEAAANLSISSAIVLGRLEPVAQTDAVGQGHGLVAVGRGKRSRMQTYAGFVPLEEPGHGAAE